MGFYSFSIRKVSGINSIRAIRFTFLPLVFMFLVCLQEPSLAESEVAPFDTFEDAKDFLGTEGVYKAISAVGLLKIQSGNKSKTCTASILDARHLITSAFCINVDATISTFIPDYYEEHKTISVEKYEVSVRPIEIDNDLGWAILEVSGNPANKYGTIKLSGKSPSIGEPLLIVHHPDYKNKKVTRFKCRYGESEVEDISYGPLFSHTCGVLRGSLGAPIFSEEGYGVIGIEVHGNGTGCSIEAIAQKSVIVRKLLEFNN